MPTSVEWNDGMDSIDAMAMGETWGNASRDPL
jgi:hypothetical protein